MTAQTHARRSFFCVFLFFLRFRFCVCGLRLFFFLQFDRVLTWTLSFFACSFGPLKAITASIAGRGLVLRFIVVAKRVVDDPFG